MDENELEAIAEAARLACACDEEYVKPEVVVDLDSFKDFSE